MLTNFLYRFMQAKDTHNVGVVPCMVKVNSTEFGVICDEPMAFHYEVCFGKLLIHIYWQDYGLNGDYFKLPSTINNFDQSVLIDNSGVVNVRCPNCSTATIITLDIIKDVQKSRQHQ